MSGKLAGTRQNVGCKLKSIVHHYLVLTTEGLQMIASMLLYDKMLLNYNLYSGMELKHRSYIKNNFDISSEVSRHENIYKKLLK